MCFKIYQQPYDTGTIIVISILHMQKLRHRGITHSHTASKLHSQGWDGGGLGAQSPTTLFKESFPPVKINGVHKGKVMGFL